jgi:hypothetical protein
MKKIVSSKKYNFFKNLVRKYGRFMGGNKAIIENKEKFEKDILKLLKKYNVIDNKHLVQKVGITCEVEKYPVIKLETLII